MKMYRQGDVLIVEHRIPSGKRRKQKDGILAHGEVTGHAHRISDLAEGELYEMDGGMFLSVSEKGISILHEEHAPIELPPGEYRVIRQREYSPEEIRNVAD